MLRATSLSIMTATGRLRSSGSKPQADIGLQIRKHTLPVSAKGRKRTLGPAGQASDFRIQFLQFALEVRLIFLRSGMEPIAALTEQVT